MSRIPQKEIPNFLDLLLAYTYSTNDIGQAIKATGETITKYEEPLNAVSRDIQANGTDLKTALNKQDMLPQQITSLLHVGSVSGKLTDILPEVSKSLKFLYKVSSSVQSAISFHAFTLVLMICAAPYLLVLVANQGDKNGSLVGFSDFVTVLMSTVPFIEYLYPLLIVGIGVSVFLYKPLRQAVISAFSIIPLVNEAVTNYQVGSWCRYFAMMTDAGIQLKDSERLLRGTLQPKIAEALKLLIDSTDKGWVAATAKERWADDDPRHVIPRVNLAFIRAGGMSGKLDEQLNLAANYSLDLAEKKFSAITKIAGVFIMLVVAGVVLFMGAQVYMSRL